MIVRLAFLCFRAPYVFLRLLWLSDLGLASLRIEFFSTVRLNRPVIMRALLRFSLLVACLLAGPTLRAAGPDVDEKDLPQVPATPPGKALGTFRIKSGFRLDLVAAEPLLVDPVAVSFDEDGRMYVVEMRDYSERRDEKLGRIRRLEDTNGDGVLTGVRFSPKVSPGRPR